MSFLMRMAAHCDICGHEWLTDKVPSHCAKCKSRKWNKIERAEGFVVMKQDAPLVLGAQLKPGWPAHSETCKCLMCKPPKP